MSLNLRELSRRATALVLAALSCMLAPMAAADAEPLPPKAENPAPPAGETPVPPVTPAAEAAPAPDPKLADGIYAKIETSKGRIYCRLFHDKAIRTVDNFVGLTEGSRSWTDPATQEKKEKTRYFDGLKFHRVEPEFVIQTGDPLNSGAGGPGYTIPDEYYPELRFDKPGMLGMARTPKPGTAGSQFFITLAPVPMLNDQYTVFGEVVDGLPVAGKIEQGDSMTKVTILRIGEAAQKYDFAAAIQARVAAGKKTLPEKIGEADPARVPAAGQAVEPALVVRGCMIVYKGAMMEGAYTDRSKEEAKALAEKVVAMARAKGADAEQILQDWTEVPADRPMHMQQGQLPPMFDAVFTLKLGQVTDPLDAPMGYIIFERVEPEIFHASHILVQYKGSARATTERTKEEAKKLADTLRARVVDKKEDFASVAQENSEDPTTKAKGGDLGEWEMGMMVPEFDEATKKLKIGDVSEVIETDFGFHVIKRMPLAPKVIAPEPLPPAPTPRPIELPQPTPVPQPAPLPAPVE